MPETSLPNPTLESLLAPLPWLNDPTVEDVSIQEPGIAWVFSGGKFSRHETTLDEEDIDDIAVVAGALRRRDFGHDKPIMGVDLSYRDGRLHAVSKPHVDGCTNLCFRRGSDEWPSLKSLVEQGLFKRVRRSSERVQNPLDQRLEELYRADRFDELLQLGAANQRTIVIAGENASGKTHLSKALIGEIPLYRRLILIENARELRGIPHPNKVCLYYDKDDPNGIKPTDLVEAGLRLRIEQMFLQEIRDGYESLAFMMAGQTGHKGAITTIHAGSCREVIDRLKGAVKMTGEGRGWDNADVVNTLQNSIDIIVHIAREGGERLVDEVLYRDYA